MSIGVSLFSCSNTRRMTAKNIAFCSCSCPGFVYLLFVFLVNLFSPLVPEKIILSNLIHLA